LFAAPPPDGEIRTRLGWEPPTRLRDGLAALYVHAREKSHV
jgi:hypothetical protein